MFVAEVRQSEGRLMSLFRVPAVSLVWNLVPLSFRLSTRDTRGINGSFPGP